MKNIISVIVATYNQEKTIGRTLDSILAQECHLPIEIVIGEDCSTDKTREICQDYASKYPSIIKLLLNEKNKGIVDNYFDCLLECEGQYIADCAGDDFWVDTKKLEKEVTIMENDKDITLVHTDWHYYNETTKDTKASGEKAFTAPITKGNEMLEAIVCQTTLPVIHLCTALYRAETILKAYKENTFLFRNKEFGCEDIQICFIMALNGKIAYIPDVTLNYSIGHESVSSPVNPTKMFLFTKRVTDLGAYIYNKYNIKKGVYYKGYMNNRIFALAMHAFRNHDTEMYKETIECCKKWDVPLNIKNHTVLTIMSHKPLWHIALFARNIILKLTKRGLLYGAQ